MFEKENFDETDHLDDEAEGESTSDELVEGMSDGFTDDDDDDGADAIFAGHEAVDMAGDNLDRVNYDEDKSAAVEAEAEAETEDRDVEFSDDDLEEAVSELSDNDVTKDVGITFDPMELSPKMREMHERLSLRAQIEAAIFASPKPVKASDLVDVVSYASGLKEVEKAIQELKEDFATREGGFTLEYIKGMGYQFQSVPSAAPIMENLFASRPRPLSRAALETLSIIAYRQPCTRAVVEFIRGVDSGSIIKNLMERDLIKCVGRKEDAGRPMLFGTTDEFLAVFSIRSLDDLPPLQAFQPASETMQQALDELDELEREVDVEEFVGDETEEKPAMGAGVLEASGADQSELGDDGVVGDADDLGEQDDEHLAQETVADSAAPGYEHGITAKPIQGAAKCEDDYDDESERQDNEDSEVDGPDGESLSAGSRKMDPGGADLS